MPVGKAFSIGLLVAVNHSIAAALALLPKQTWSFADIRCARERPILAYVISGMSTLTIALPVSYAFYLLRVHFLPDSGPIMPYAGQCKWLLLPTVLSVAIAFTCDDFAGTASEPSWLRWVEGASTAGLMALTGLLVMRWLQIDQTALHPNGTPPPLWMPMLLKRINWSSLWCHNSELVYRQTMRQGGTMDNTMSPRFPDTQVLVAGD